MWRLLLLVVALELAAWTVAMFSEAFACGPAENDPCSTLDVVSGTAALLYVPAAFVVVLVAAVARAAWRSRRATAATRSTSP